MLKFLSIEDNEGKYQFAGLMVIIGLFFWGELRLTVFLRMPWTAWELLAYLGAVILMMYLFYIGPLQKKQKAQEKVSAIDYADSMIRRGKNIPEDLMLSFREVYELEIDFDDDSTLKARLESKSYERFYNLFLQSQIIQNVEKGKSTTKEILTASSLNELLGNLIPRLRELKENGELPNLIGESQENQKRNVMKENPSNNHEGINIETTSKEELIPYQNFDLDKIQNDEKFQKDKEILKSLNFYYAVLETEEKFEEEKEGWKECIIVIPSYTYKEALETRKGEGFYKGWPVNLRECFCFWEYWWQLSDNIPVLYLLFSENMDKPILEPLKNIKAESFTYLQLKVMEVWMNDLSVRPEKLEMQNKFYQQKAISFRNTLSDTIQDQAKENIVFSKFLRNPIQLKLKSEIEKYKRRFYLALMGILVVGLIGGLILAFII
ncbi:MAG: hypothetical protein ACTSRH_08615 [Promethearchaeota archaeon]